MRALNMYALCRAASESCNSSSATAESPGALAPIRRDGRREHPESFRRKLERPSIAVGEEAHFIYHPVEHERPNHTAPWDPRG